MKRPLCDCWRPPDTMIVALPFSSVLYSNLHSYVTIECCHEQLITQVLSLPAAPGKCSTTCTMKGSRQRPC